jgi:hypothetical protein
MLGYATASHLGATPKMRQKSRYFAGNREIGRKRGGTAPLLDVT